MRRFDLTHLWKWIAWLSLAWLLIACRAAPGETDTPGATAVPSATARPSSTPPPSASPTERPTASPSPTLPPSPTPTPLPRRPQYALQALFDYNQHTLEVSQAVTYTNRLTTTLTDLLLVVEANRWPGAFQIHALNWADGAPVQGYTFAAHRLTIPLALPLPPGQSIGLSLAYTLNLPLIPPETARPQIFGYSERQANLVDWYPHIPPYRRGWLAHDASYFGEYQVYELADFVIDLRLQNPPEGLILAGSALPQSTAAGFHYVAAAARSFSLSASPQYQVESGAAALPDGQSVSVTHYFFPFTSPMAQAVLTNTIQAVELYSRLFAPYPHSSLSVVQADFLDGMEYDGLFFLSRGFYNTYNGRPDDYLISIAAHETAHQWWYALIGSDQALDPWLDEALSTYSEWLFYENFYPSLLEGWWAKRVEFYKPEGQLGRAVYDYPGFVPYRDAVYLRGAQFLRQLRASLGDEAFLAFLKDYARRQAGQLATRQDFFNILEAHTSPEVNQQVMALISEYFIP